MTDAQPPAPAADAATGTSIAARIRMVYASLPPAHRQLADHVLAHPLQAATQPIDELAAAAAVSIATANRFVRLLGLEGYPQLRAALVRDFEAMLAPIESMRVRVQQPRCVHDVFSAALEHSQRNIAATAAALSAAQCDAAVAAILGAQRIYLNGLGASAWLAGLLQQGLDPYCPQVQLLPSVAGPSYGARMLSRMGEGDLMIALSFPRYLADTLRLARAAHERGTRILALTDSPTAPLAALAHILLCAHTHNPYAANSESTVLALIEALCSAVAHHSSHSVQNAARMMEPALAWLHDGAAAPTNAPSAANAASTPAPTPAPGPQAPAPTPGRRATAPGAASSNNAPRPPSTPTPGRAAGRGKRVIVPSGEAALAPAKRHPPPAP